MPQILMCPPTYYGIEYEINPWMSRSHQSDREIAQSQWDRLRALIEDCGAETVYLEPQRGLPDMVFTANAAMVHERTAILAHFRHPERQGETPYAESWFRQNGFDVLPPPEGISFEGAGDALFCGEILFAGYRTRSDARGHQQIGEILNRRAIPVELVNPSFYHLDTCFCPLAEGQAIWYPEAFDDYGRRAIREHVPRLMEVATVEAAAFACNAVVIGRHVITNEGCPQLAADLTSAGFTPHATPLREFVKAGGSAKCLTLRLDGEEAAPW